MEKLARTAEDSGHATLAYNKGDCDSVRRLINIVSYNEVRLDGEPKSSSG